MGPVGGMAVCTPDFTLGRHNICVKRTFVECSENSEQFSSRHTASAPDILNDYKERGELDLASMPPVNSPHTTLLTGRAVRIAKLFREASDAFVRLSNTPLEEPQCQSPTSATCSTHRNIFKS